LDAREFAEHFLIRLDESHFDAEFARRLLNLGKEEQVLDETVDTRGSVLPNRNDRLGGSIEFVAIPVAITVAVRVYVAVPQLDGGGRRICDITVHGTVTVVHRTNENLLFALLALAPAAATLLSIAVPILLEKAVLTGGLRLLPLTGLAGLIGLILLGRLSICLRGRFVALSSAPPSAVSLILSLWTLRFRRLGLRLRLGQVLLCCHACTSWRVTE
jgi:hypothetical protein